MTLGNLVALRQTARGAPAGLVVGGPGRVHAGAARGGRQRRPGARPAGDVAYVLTYAAMNLAAFAVVAAVGRGRARRSGSRTIAAWPRASPGRPGRSPWPSSSAWPGCRRGIVGLLAKVGRVRRAGRSGAAAWLAVVMAVNVVIGLAYYLPLGSPLFAPPVGEVGGPLRGGVPTGGHRARRRRVVVLSVAPESSSTRLGWNTDS